MYIDFNIYPVIIAIEIKNEDCKKDVEKCTKLLLRSRVLSLNIQNYYLGCTINDINQFHTCFFFSQRYILHRVPRLFLIPKRT